MSLFFAVLGSLLKLMSFQPCQLPSRGWRLRLRGVLLANETLTPGETGVSALPPAPSAECGRHMAVSLLGRHLLLLLFLKACSWNVWLSQFSKMMFGILAFL